MSLRFPMAMITGLVLLVGLLAGCGGGAEPSGTAATPRESAAPGGDGDVKYSNTANLDLRFHQETAEDVVRSSDQVVIVRAESVEEVEDKPLSPGERDELRTIFREITFRVESSVWRRPGEAQLKPGSEFAALTGGILSPDGEKTTYKGMAFIEPGQRYLMPVTERRDEWTPELPLATFPVDGSEVQLAPHQDTRLARDVSGVRAASLAEVFSEADGRATVCHMADIDTSAGPITVRLPCRADLHLANLGEAKVVQDGEHCLEIDYSLKGQESTRVFCPRS